MADPRRRKSLGDQIDTELEISRVQRQIEALEPSPPKIGRPATIPPEGEEILSNGLFQRQWDWIKREARGQGLLGAQLQRQIIDLHIADVEASRVPEAQGDDGKNKINKSNRKKV